MKIGQVFDEWKKNSMLMRITGGGGWVGMFLDTRSVAVVGCSQNVFVAVYEYEDMLLDYGR